MTIQVISETTEVNLNKISWVDKLTDGYGKNRNVTVTALFVNEPDVH